MVRYVAGAQVSLPVTAGVVLWVPFGSLAATLLLAEAYEHEGRLDEGIGLLQQLVQEDDADPALLLSLCDLYAEQAAWDEIVELAAGRRNEDDLSCGIVTLYARALSGQGLHDAALAALKDALKSSKRSEGVLNEARYRRALVHAARGDERRARQDLERVYAIDPGYADVAARLGQD
jgi:tetratricopeptide (TPR) repeat protein